MYQDTGSQNRPEPYLQQEDATLLTLIQEGDEHAMALLYDRYSRVVYSVALRVLCNPASAEDVLQEVFMRIWRSPSGFTASRGNLGGCLAVVSRNRPLVSLDATAPPNKSTKWSCRRSMTWPSKQSTTA